MIEATGGLTGCAVASARPPAPAPPLSLALLVDGENVPQSQAGRIILTALGFGALTVRRVYGDLTKLPAWEQAAGFRAIHSGTGKNATDMLIVIDAMDLIHRGGIGGIVIASSDRDFAHLAHHLRERGFPVLGIGEAKAPRSFRMACTRFVELPPLVHDRGPVAAVSVVAPAPAGAPAPAASAGCPPAPNSGSLEDAVVAVLRSAGAAGLSTAILNPEVAKRHPVRIGATPERTWRAWLAARPALFVTETCAGGQRVRLR